MKKKIIMIITVLCLGLVFTGCGKNADKNSIVGKWEYESGGFTYTFKEDKTGTYDVNGNIMKFTYETDGDKLSILYDGDTTSFDTTYSIEGNKLNVKDSLGNDTIYIRK